MFFLWYLLIGLVAGWIANLIVKGRGSGLLVNLVVGIIGGVLGGWLFRFSASLPSARSAVSSLRSSERWFCCGSLRLSAPKEPNQPINTYGL